MSYQDTKDTLKEIRSNEREARKELEALQDRSNTIDADLNSAYERYLQMQADEKAGECTKDDVSKAEREYLKLKSEKNDLQSEIDVSERVVSILKGKVRDAESEFNREAVPYHKKELEKRFTTIQSALHTINNEIDKVNAYRKELQKDQVSDSLLQGIKHHSQAVITKKNTGSLGMKEFLTSFKGE